MWNLCPVHMLMPWPLDHPSGKTTFPQFWGWSLKRGSTVLWSCPSKTTIMCGNQVHMVAVMSFYLLHHNRTLKSSYEASPSIYAWEWGTDQSLFFYPFLPSRAQTPSSQTAASFSCSLDRWTSVCCCTVKQLTRFLDSCALTGWWIFDWRWLSDSIRQET